MTLTEINDEFEAVSGYVKQSWSLHHSLIKNLQQVPDETVVRLTSNWRNKRILDLGCGGGRHAEYLERLGNQVWGIDYVDIPHFRGERMVKLDLTHVDDFVELCTAKEIDTILGTQIFDHLPLGVAEALIEAIDSATPVSEIVLSFFTDQCFGVVREKWVEDYGWLASLGDGLSELHNFFPDSFFFEMLSNYGFIIDKQVKVNISEVGYIMDSIYLRAYKRGQNERAC